MTARAVDDGSVRCAADGPLRAHDAYIAVGSNIDPERNVVAALEKLRGRVEVVGVSTFYRSAAVGGPEQPAFVNGVVHVRTARSPRGLKFEVLRRIEDELGRIRGQDKFAPRTIDLDLVLYDRCVIDEPELRIPDPGIGERPFVAVPLLELAPDLAIADSGRAPASTEAASAAAEDLEALPELTRRLRGED